MEGKPGLSLAQMKTVFRVKTSNITKSTKAMDKEGNSEYEQRAFHSRRAYTKSRNGCTSCKQRRIKCDERQPRCQKCRDSDEACKYVNKSASISAAEMRVIERLGSTGANIAGRASPLTAQYDMSLAQTAASLNALLQSAGDLPNYLHSGNNSFVQILQHFETATYATTGSPTVQDVVKHSNLKFAMKYPYLMHATLAFGAAHLKHLLPFSANPAQYRQNALAEAYHWQRASHLFREELNSPLGLGFHNMDPVLTTSMLLSRQSFLLDDGELEFPTSFVELPLDQTASAINWFTVQAGVKSLLIAFQPHISKSVWFPVFMESDDRRGTFFDERAGSEGLPQGFAELCEITETSTIANNPYHAPLRLLAPLLQIEAGTPNFTKLITFMGRMGLHFHALLIQKEARALLILAYWLALMSRIPQWWIVGRARYECAAICAFLRNHPDPRVGSLLEFPEKICAQGLSKGGHSKPNFGRPWTNLREESTSSRFVGEHSHPNLERSPTNVSGESTASGVMAGHSQPSLERSSTYLSQSNWPNFVGGRNDPNLEMSPESPSEERTSSGDIAS